MYKARNGFILKDDTTAQGWTIRTPQDLITALLAFPVFQTVDTGIIWQALDDATENRKEYDDIQDLADFLAAWYI